MKQKVISVIFCVILMTITAASDSLRGIFLPMFTREYELSGSGASAVIMVSYIGNLLFLLVGGYLSDRLPRRVFIGGMLTMWALALLTYVLTENYVVLLIGMVFSMGGSTMLATTVNLLTPLMFAAPAMLVNIFNFCQGAGITAAQYAGGHAADSNAGWHAANLILLIAALVCIVLMLFLELPPKAEKAGTKKEPPQPDKRQDNAYLRIFTNRAALPLIGIAGCYFIAEHGMSNWLTSYGSEHLGYTVPEAASYLSLFFGTLTVGRLIFAPLVQKLGIRRSMVIFSTAAAVMYCAGIFTGREGILVLCLSGLGFSILYPTMVLMIGEYFDKQLAGTATGAVLAAATLFDIAFNAFFGGAVENFGFGAAINVMPAAMILFTAGIWAMTMRRKNLEE